MTTPIQIKKISTKEINNLLKNTFNVKLFKNEENIYEVDSSEDIKTIVLRAINLQKEIRDNTLEELTDGDKYKVLLKYPELNKSNNEVNNYKKLKSGSMTTILPIKTLKTKKDSDTKVSNNEGLSFLSFKDQEGNKSQLIEKELIKDIELMELNVMGINKEDEYVIISIDSIEDIYNIEDNIKITNLILKNIKQAELLKLNLKLCNAILKKYQTKNSYLDNELPVVKILKDKNYEKLAPKDVEVEGVYLNEEYIKPILEEEGVETSRDNVYVKKDENGIHILFISFMKIYKVNTKNSKLDYFSTNSLIDDKKEFSRVKEVEINGKRYRLVIETKSAREYMIEDFKMGISETQLFTKFSKMLREIFEKQLNPNNTITYTNDKDKKILDIVEKSSDKENKYNHILIESFNDKNLLDTNYEVLLKQNEDILFSLYKRTRKNEQSIETNKNQDLHFIDFFKINGSVNREMINTMLFLEDKINNLQEKGVTDIKIDLERVVDKKDQEGNISKNGFIDVIIKYNLNGKNYMEIYENKSLYTYIQTKHQEQCNNYVISSLKEVKNNEYNCIKNDYINESVVNSFYSNNVNGINILHK